MSYKSQTLIRISNPKEVAIELHENGIGKYALVTSRNVFQFKSPEQAIRFFSRCLNTIVERELI